MTKLINDKRRTVEDDDNMTKDEGIEQIKKTFSSNKIKKNKKNILQVRLLLAETTPWSPGHWTPSPPGEPHGDYGDGDGLVDGEPHGDYDEDAAAVAGDGNVI